MDRFGQPAAHRIARASFAALICIAACSATLARAEFTTVINSPPDVLFGTYGSPYVGSNTQINWYEGAAIWEYNYALGDPWQPSDNIEFNLLGGSILGTLITGWEHAPATNVVVNIHSGGVGNSVHITNGNVVNVSGGIVGQRLLGGLNLSGGSSATISGGVIANVELENESDLTMSGGHIGVGGFSGGVVIGGNSTGRISGGVIEGGVHVLEGSQATISGGVVPNVGAYFGGQVQLRGGALGSLNTNSDSRMNLVGGDFRINGAPIAGLGTPGSEVPITIPANGVLTGVLADGSAVIVTHQGYFGDSLADGSLSLTSALIPPTTPQILRAPDAAVPHSLRAGQRLELRAGAVAPANLRATWGSSILIDGGAVGPRFRAAGAVVDLVSGNLGELAVFTMGSVLNVSGGVVGPNLNAVDGSTVNVSGGLVGGLFEALPGSRVSLSGGAVEDNFYAHDGSAVTIQGSGFRINGTPVAGLASAGATRNVDLPADAVLSGVYADGRPFAFSSQSWDYLAPGTLTLRAVPPPTAVPGMIHVNSSAAPTGLRAGQMMTVAEGGELPSHFNAEWGSVLNVEGGRVAANFEAVGALVNISGGNVGDGLRTLYGSAANISGGTLEGYAYAGNGSTINVSGGAIEYGLIASDGATVNVSGGAVFYLSAHGGGVANISGGRIDGGIQVESATVNISGGQIGDGVGVWRSSALNLSGGTFGDRMQVNGGSRLTITGDEFRIDGVPILTTDFGGQAAPISIPAGSVFSGILQDGTPFAFSDRDNYHGHFGDQFELGSVYVVRDYNPLPVAAPIVDYAGFLAPTGLQGGATAVVDADHRLGDNFVAAWGSSVTMVGGSIGRNFEAVGAQVLIAGGVVGPEGDAFRGSQITMTGGSLGENFTAHKGSSVTILGGDIGNDLTIGVGSIVNIHGGVLQRPIYREPDSDLNFFGTQFEFNGWPIPDFGPGQSVTLADEEGWLTGRFDDGTSFEVYVFGDSHLESDVSLPKARLTLSWLMTGDLNGDSYVDAADLATWRSTPTNGNDFLAWQRQLGSRAAPVNQPVPEPMAWTLACVVLLAFRLSNPVRPSRSRRTLFQ
jgi:hypothetical protein